MKTGKATFNLLDVSVNYLIVFKNFKALYDVVWLTYHDYLFMVKSILEWLIKMNITLYQKRCDIYRKLNETGY